MISTRWPAVSEREDLATRIDTFERGYEFLLAYAAQGRQDDAGSEARAVLTAMHAALDGLAPAARASLPGADSDVGAWLDALDRDVRVARGALALVLSKARIGSLLVDNLNASVHLRALLTDLFLLEQSLKG
jgi:hypothetical protein